MCLGGSGTSAYTLKTETVVPQGLQNFYLLQHSVITWKNGRNVF
jgi:hypothetical protein